MTPLPHRAAEPSFADQLELLAAMSRDFADNRNIDHALQEGLERITSYLEAAGGALFRIDGEGGAIRCMASVGATDIRGLALARGQGIVGRCIAMNRGELVRDVAADPGFFGGVDETTGFTTKSIVCAPMSVRDGCIGAIELVNKNGADPRFDLPDLRILETMASTAALAILNAQMAEALVEQERVRRELELAAEIQRSLLPPPVPRASPIQGLNVPAGAVSGDFFDFFELPDGRICFTLGDVSGKGMNAAFLMAKTTSLFRCLGRTAPEPGQLLARINGEICERITRGMFVTAVAGVYDPARGSVRLSNAGHEPPLLLGAGDGGSGATTVPAHVPPLGVLPPEDLPKPFPETVLDLAGGTLFLFSDGVTEGNGPDGSPLGDEGLRSLLAATAGRPLPDRIEGVANHLTGDGRAQRDDITLLAIDDREAARKRVNNVGAAGAPCAGRAASEPQSLARLSVPARADCLKLVRHVISQTATMAGCPEADVRDLTLAVDEACQNVIRHAYGGTEEGTMAIDVQRDGDALVVLLRDFAAPVDVARIQPRDLADVKPGGLGTHLIRACVDEVAFQPPPADGGNLLRLAKRIHKAAASRGDDGVTSEP